jgi:CRISPR-associated protein Csd2
MAVKKVIWWKHGSKAGQCSSAKVHGSLTVDLEGNITLAETCVTPEIINGF